MAANGVEQLDSIINRHPGKLVLYLADKEYSGHQQLCTVLESLKQDFPQIAFEALEHSVVKDKVKVNALPCFLCYKGGKVVNTLEGCSTSMLVTFVRGWSKESSQETTLERIKRLIAENPVILFMKGEKENPFCRFSRAVVNMFNESGIVFEGYNIFEDPELREELKVYSNWPTYPQLYVNGNLIGGHDIIKELFENGALRDEIPEANLKPVQ
ncbi:glutaredoxin family like protein [Babesia gibsoni]|uniref:Glutaredoxin family like protein n=1 Tax=Babesia gibsoni TaxID=33632 RepID=A0AAD8PEG1_BABGI|nr:glutaredoxin family like protein [Babesia gibsoni]